MSDILLKTAQEQYPILRDVPFNYKYNPSGGDGFLEFWPADESGTPDRPRPAEFPPGQVGVEVYNPNTRPIDILGDVVSHHLVKTDPTLKGFYDAFKGSLTQGQKSILQRQYFAAQKEYGEERNFYDWLDSSGLPAYFRGYAFKQWDNPEQLYTPGQMRMFDQMMQHLTKGRE